MSQKIWVSETMWKSAFDDHHLQGFPQRQGRGIEITFKAKRASSVGAIDRTSSAASSFGHTSDSDCEIASSGCSTPPTRALVSMVHGRRGSLKLQLAALDQETNNAEESENESKPAAVAAAVITFMMAMLSCPLSPCLPPTHVHLSRLPIGTGHSIVLDALRREWPGHDFDIKLHVYQRTRHVSGVASVTPGLLPEDLEAIRHRPNLYVPLGDSGDKMIVEESKRDKDPRLYKKYKEMVLQGLGIEVPDAPPLKVTEPPLPETPVIYMRIMADRMQSNGLLTCVGDIKEAGLLYMLERFPLGDGRTVADAVQLVAADKSANKQHMHRSHFGRAYFLECSDVETAALAMRAIQKDSIQNIDSMMFSLHVEIKKGSGGRGRLFEQDAQKRQNVEGWVASAKAVVESLEHRPCGCSLPGNHNISLHSLFTFKGFRHGFFPRPVPVSGHPAPSSCSASLCGRGESALLDSDRMSVGGSSDSDAGSIAPSVASSAATRYYTNQPYQYQPYSMGYAMGYQNWHHQQQPY